MRYALSGDLLLPYTVESGVEVTRMQRLVHEWSHSSYAYGAKVKEEIKKGKMVVERT